MSQTAYRRILCWPCDYQTNGGNTGLSYSIDASTKKWAAGFIVSEAITLAKLAVYIHTETGTSPAYTWRIETDDGSGRPSGTLAWANATVDVTVTATGWTALQTLTASQALTPGTIYHFVIQPSGVNPDASNFVAIRENSAVGLTSGNGMISTVAYLPCYSSRYNSGWANGGGAPVFVLSDSTSTVMLGQTIDTGNLLTWTNTAWKGVKFVAPFSGTLWGAAISKVNSTSAGAVAAKLIDNSNTILTTGTIPAGWFDVNTARDYDLFVFDTPQSITSGSTYRCVWKDPAGVQRFDYYQCSSSTFKILKPGKDQFILTEGTSSDGTASPTTWTDSDDKEMKFGLFASSVSAGGTGGGGNLLGNGTLLVA